jgi:hypothetical protein
MSMPMPGPDSFLKKQLEQEKFLHAVTYVKNEARGIKRLSSNELAHLNQMLTMNDDPWRAHPVKITIPSGDTHDFNVMANPQASARSFIGAALEMLGNDDLLGAVFYLYVKLVTEHLFTDANRRTAVLAILWLCESFGKPIDPDAILNIPVGNLRSPKDLAKLKSDLASLL